MDKSPLITLLRTIGMLFPGNRLKTWVYLNWIHRPRKWLRLSLSSFYRMDHIYDVISEFTKTYKGSFSILEFGVADGYAFTKKLYATQYLKVADRITVHGFDTFEGMHATDDARDKDLVARDGWVEGQFTASYEKLLSYCQQHYSNFALHRGYFSDTLTEAFLEQFIDAPPILIWIDCDYYTSAKSAMERLMPYIPSGCVIYFDEYEFNYGSRATGEARLVHEINRGMFGEQYELILDRHLSLNLNRVYRFINLEAPVTFERFVPMNLATELRRRTNDSPFP